jgi:hypothetical protein
VERVPSSRRPVVYTGEGEKVRRVGWGAGGRGEGGVGDETRALWERRRDTRPAWRFCAMVKGVVEGRCRWRRRWELDMESVVVIEWKQSGNGKERRGRTRLADCVLSVVVYRTLATPFSSAKSIPNSSFIHITSKYWQVPHEELKCSCN